MTHHLFSRRTKTAAVGVVAAFALVPFFASAVDTFVEEPLTPPFKLAFSADGKSSLAVTPDTAITLKWNAGSGSSGKGCVANWKTSSRTTPVLSTQGEESVKMADRNKTFIVTCSGIGIAQTAKVQVTVTKPDLVVSVPRISNASLGGGKYLSGSTLISVIVQNPSAVPVTQPFKVVIQFKRKNRDGESSFRDFIGASTVLTSGPGFNANFTVPTLAPKEKKELVHEGQSFGNEPANTYFFRACVDEGAEVKTDGTNDNDAIDETNERNNCSSQTKAFIFADRR